MPGISPCPGHSPARPVQIGRVCRKSIDGLDRILIRRQFHAVVERARGEEAPTGEGRGCRGFATLLCVLMVCLFLIRIRTLIRVLFILKPDHE